MDIYNAANARVDCLRGTVYGVEQGCWERTGLECSKRRALTAWQQFLKGECSRKAHPLQNQEL